MAEFYIQRVFDDLLDENLRSGEVLLLAVLAHSKNKQTGRCNPGDDRLRKLTRLGASTIPDLRKSLVEKGLISYTCGKGYRSHKYELLFLDREPSVRKDPGVQPDEKIPVAPSETPRPLAANSGVDASGAPKGDLGVLARRAAELCGEEGNEIKFARVMTDENRYYLYSGAILLFRRHYHKKAKYSKTGYLLSMLKEMNAEKAEEKLESYFSGAGGRRDQKIAPVGNLTPVAEDLMKKLATATGIDSGELHDRFAAILNGIAEAFKKRAIACEIIEDCGKDVKSAREKLKELALATSLEKYEQ